MRNPVLWATVLSATLISTQLSAADLPGKGVSVQPVQSTISEETFQTLGVLVQSVMGNTHTCYRLGGKTRLHSATH